MKKTLSVATAVSLALLSTAGHAETQNSIRLDVSANAVLTTLDDGFDEVSISETSMQGLLTLQSAFGAYAELGTAKFTVDEIEINGRTWEVDEDYDANMLGLGFRFQTPDAAGQYLGLGLRQTEYPDADNDSMTVRAFSEKDTDLRYGVIEVAYTSDDESSLLGVSGRHVWFFNGVVGLGVNWGVGFGSIDTPSGYPDIDTGTAHIGGILMIRPRF
ncbi:hypothetical protein Q4485_14325 [Granulosicoccaceae sp. 1_MG-2023]|nr:hypothetical protein [Granulosicoccaceae sp. 1_MG-2023]